MGFRCAGPIPHRRLYGADNTVRSSGREFIPAVADCRLQGTADSPTSAALSRAESGTKRNQYTIFYCIFQGGIARARPGRRREGNNLLWILNMVYWNGGGDAGKRSSGRWIDWSLYNSFCSLRGPTSASPEVGKSDQRALPFGIPPAWRDSSRRRALDRKTVVAA